ncbi:MAG: cytochrome c family protein [Rhodobacteraceae bacterium]|nr:MAG: cytochrome c family protein [Paracoccaceae bacterium]
MLKRTIILGAVLAHAGLPVAAQGDAAKGEKIFNRCKSCHAVGEDAKNKVGPVLNGIVGSPAGTNPDFKYSDALLEKAAEGLIWDEESLTAYLTKPGDFIPKTKMAFPGLRKESDITDLISYLATFSS